jgi:molybdenum cofactor cytidylyltransferase
MIAGLVLAAGESSRMGSDKALLKYRGRTFLETIVSTLHEAGVRRTVVVLGHHAEEIQHAVNLEGSAVVINRGYRRGQTSSLQTGLQALEGADIEAFVLCLVDHPDVSADMIRGFTAAFQESHPPVVIPTHKGKRGHRGVISRQLFEELKSLGPEQGADAVIRKYRNATRFLDVADPGILIDVDSPEAYEDLCK